MKKRNPKQKAAGKKTVRIAAVGAGALVLLAAAGGLSLAVSRGTVADAPPDF